MSKRVAVVGSRGFPDLQMVRDHVAGLPKGTIVVSGGASGPDYEAVLAARTKGFGTFVYPADWQKHGKRAGYLRNRTIVANCDRVVAFWDGKSRGTRHTIDLARAAGKPVEIIYPMDKTEPGCHSRHSVERED